MWQALFHVSSTRSGLSGQVEGSVGLQVKHLPLEVNFCKGGGRGAGQPCLRNGQANGCLAATDARKAS